MAARRPVPGRGRQRIRIRRLLLPEKRVFLPGKPSLSGIFQRRQRCGPPGLRNGSLRLFKKRETSGRGSTRTDRGYAALRPLPHMPKRVQAEVHPSATRLHPHRIASVSLRGMRETFPPAKPFDPAHSNSYQRKTLPVRLLRTEFPPADDIKSTFANTHGTETL